MLVFITWSWHEIGFERGLIALVEVVSRKKKGNQRWSWHAIDYTSGKVLAYVFRARKDGIFSQLKALLMLFVIKYFYTDRVKIKRLARKTICFSKLEKRHNIVIGLFINRCVWIGRLISNPFFGITTDC